MAAYFAMRIKDKYNEEGIEAAHTYYNQVFSIAKYQQFQAETDTILINDGYEHLIPKTI